MSGHGGAAATTPEPAPESAPGPTPGSTPGPASPRPATVERRTLPLAARVPGYLAGGALIGGAEVVPGVSGGTVALVVGLYERLIASADHVVEAVRALLTPRRGRPAAHAELRQVSWLLVALVGVGMVTAVVVGAALLEPLLEDYPAGTRAVFAGFIAVSVYVPLRMVSGIRALVDLVWLVPAAVAAFVLTGLPPTDLGEPSLLLVALAAAVAVCALVLPGVSGSFLLLSVGLYEPTLSAVNDRDLAYLGAFALGAVVGLALFVRLLRWLLARRRRPTLLLMAGLMIGSLRALWPWQDDDRALLAPPGVGDAVAAAALAAVAGLFVAVLIAVEHRVAKRVAEQSRGELAPG